MEPSTQETPSPARTGSHGQSFVPALGLSFLTRFYDPLVRFALREDEMRRRLVLQAGIAPQMDVLDLGCGTGTLLLALKRMVPEARVHGVDVDPEILAIARDKIDRAGLDVALHQGGAGGLPFPSARFDRVLTSLVLHHLTTEEKRSALRDVRRVLRPGGELHVADFGRPQNALMGLLSYGVQLFDGADRLAVNLEGRLPELVREAGFDSIALHGDQMTPFGTLAFFSARHPG